MLRLFVGAYPNSAWAHRALCLLDGLAIPPRARPTPAPQLHLTLQFIGDASEKSLPSVIESVARAASGIESFDLAPVRLMALPERGDARLIALELDRPARLAELHNRLSTRLARRPRARPSDDFIPHITLCRFDPGPRPVGLPNAVDLAPLRVAEIQVVRSILHPSGASHTPMRRIPLFDPSS